MAENLNLGSVNVDIKADASSLDKQITKAEKKLGDLSFSVDETTLKTKQWGAASSNAAMSFSATMSKASDNIVSANKRAASSHVKHAKAVKNTSEETGKLKKATDKFTTSLKDNLFSLNAVAASVASALATGTVIAYSDAYKSAQNQIRQTVNSTEELTERTEQLFAIAERSRVGIGATAELYTNLNLSTKDLNLSTAKQLRLVETISKSFAVSGKSAQESAGAIRQLGQAMASGTLRGDEFNSIAENAPEIMRALQKSLNKTQGELRAFAATGGITAKILVEALESYSSVVDDKLAKSTKTFAQQAEIARNNMTKFIGESKALESISSGLGAGLVTLSENIDSIAKFATIAGVAYAAKFTPAVLSSTVAMGKSLTVGSLYGRAISMLGVKAATSAIAVRGFNMAVSALGGPIGLAITALTSYVLLKDEVKSKTEQLEESTNELAKSFELLSKSAAEARMREYTAQIKETREEIDKAKESAKQAQVDFAGMGGRGVTQAAKKLDKLNDELERLTAERNKLAQIHGDPLGALARGIESTAQKITGFSSTLSSLANTGASTFESLKHSAKSAFEQFKTTSVQSLDNQIETLSSRVQELQASTGGPILGLALTAEQQQVKDLTAELERLKQMRESIAGKAADKDTGKSKGLSDEEKAFIASEKAKTQALKIESEERKKLNEIAKEFHSKLFMNEFEEMQAISKMMLDEERVRLDTNKKLLEISHAEEIASIHANEKLKGEVKEVALAEANARYLETIKVFNSELEAEAINASARNLDIQREFMDALASGQVGLGMSEEMLNRETEFMKAAAIEMLEFKAEQDAIELERKKALLDSKIALEREARAVEIDEIYNNESLKGEARAKAIAEADKKALEKIRAFEKEKSNIINEAEQMRIELDAEMKQVKAELELEQSTVNIEKIFDETESILEAMGLRYESLEQQELEHLARKQAILDEALAKELMSKEEHEKQSQAIKKKGSEISNQLASQDMSMALSTFSSGSKKLTKAMEAVSIANAVKSGYEAATHAWKWGMASGGPPTAIAYTGASLLKTAGLIKSIKSGGKSQSGGGGGSTPTVSAPVAPQQQQQTVSRNINVNIVGEGIMSTDQVRALIGQINDQVGSGVEILTNNGG